MGILSVFWWAWTGDLRLYIWIQLLPLIVIPLVALLLSRENNEDRFIMLSLLCYVFAKAAEHYDRALYALMDHTVSGHTLKHLAAAAGCASLFFVLRVRAQKVRGNKSGQQSVADSETAQTFTTDYRQ